MAKEMKARTYRNIDATTGLGTLVVTVDGEEGKERKTQVNGVATTQKAFADLVANAMTKYVSVETPNEEQKKGNKTLDDLFSIYTRGVESAARVSFKSKHNTTVSLGGGKKVDLMEFAESTNPKAGLKNAILIINNRFDTLDLLMATASTTDKDGKEKSAEILRDEAAKTRKREAGWYNTAEALVSAGKAKRVNDRLVIA